MKKDKRWLLLLTAIIGIIGGSDALKATSLIFGRGPSVNKNITTTTTTKTTTEAAALQTDANSKNDATVARNDDGTASGEDEEEVVTKPPLTGIPQIDYVWDPNLPHELNGFNLSTYPFLNSVPDNDDIDFKCDGLHDGFYASIKFGCQLYHHCVYGIRHDFLCANFTAFDQKSFICHFVSEVNCKSSAKYWFRNDALYKATTTTSTTTTTRAPPPTTSQAPVRRPAGRRPMRRRRPQQDYYYDYEDYDNDYTEERFTRRRKPNRQRNRRPEYDDDGDYGGSRKVSADDSYEERPAHRERERSRNRGDDVDDYEYERRTYDRPRNRNRPNESRRYKDEDRRDLPNERRLSKDRRPTLDDRRTYDEDRDGFHDDRRSSPNDRKSHADDRRSSVDDRRTRLDMKESHSDEPRRGHVDRRRPIPSRIPQYDDDDEEYEASPKRGAGIKETAPPKAGVVPKVRSGSPVASIFSRPRQPPRISRPVPTNEKKKYEYKNSPIQAKPRPAESLAAEPADDEQYEEYDYEAELPEAQPETKPAVPETKAARAKAAEPFSGAKPQPIDSEDFVDDEIIGEPETPNRKPTQKPSPVKQQSTNVRAADADYKQENSPPEAYEGEDDELAEYADFEADEKEAQRPREEEKSPPKAPQQADLAQKRQQSNVANAPLRTTSIPPFRFMPSAAAPVPSANHKLETHPKSYPPQPIVLDRDVYLTGEREQASRLPEPSGFKPVGYNGDTSSDIESDQFRSNRPLVRIMKRPFLPSRGGSPYLPRGLKPVGGGATNAEYAVPNRSPAIIEQTQVSGVHLLQHSQQNARVNHKAARPTQQPQDTLRSSLDDIYNSDYDVTINDALNPTLKPITQSHEAPAAYALTKYDRASPYARSDVSQASSVYRSTAIQAPINVQSRNRQPVVRATQQYEYDEYEY